MHFSQVSCRGSCTFSFYSSALSWLHQHLSFFNLTQAIHLWPSIVLLLRSIKMLRFFDTVFSASKKSLKLQYLGIFIVTLAISLTLCFPVKSKRIQLSLCSLFSSLSLVFLHLFVLVSFSAVDCVVSLVKIVASCHREMVARQPKTIISKFCQTVLLAFTFYFFDIDVKNCSNNDYIFYIIFAFP